MSVYQKAIDKYGVRSQMIKSLEELTELSHALCRSLLHEDVTVAERLKLEEAVREELADVRIMVTQLEIIFDEALCLGWFQKKLGRLCYRLDIPVESAVRDDGYEEHA